jgi:hypothetical protein
MAGKRSISEKMEEVSMKWFFSKSSPKLTAFLKRTDAPLSGFVQSKGFKSVCNFLVLANILFIVIQAEANVSAAIDGQDSNLAFDFIDMLFSIAFAVDLMLRLIGQRASFFYTQDKAWNVLDFCLVTGDGLNEIAAIALNSPSGNLASLRGAARASRAARVARTLRVFRSVSFFTLPREVVAAFSAVPFMMMLWFFISLFFALIFVQATAEALKDGDGQNAEAVAALEEYFGSVKRSLTSLFFVLLGGLDWVLFYDAFDQTSTVYSYLFLAFAFFSIVAFLNSITAMCVQSCFARVVRNEIDGKMEAAGKLAKLLIKTADKKYHNPLAGRKTHVCSWADLHKMLADPMVHGALEGLGLDRSDAQGIAKLMTKDDQTPANMQDYARACVKFTRTVRGADFVAVLLTSKKIMMECRTLKETLQNLRKKKEKRDTTRT